MGESIDQINHYLDYAFMYGPVLVYAAIFAACFIENIAPPFPGDTFIVVAGGLAALGRLDWRVAFMAVIVGGISSIMLYYYLGRHFGHDYFRRKNFRFFTIDDIDAVQVSQVRRSAAGSVALRSWVSRRACRCGRDRAVPGFQNVSLYADFIYPFHRFADVFGLQTCGTP
jgi:membrane protein YqaA with SNARE-associated domain